MVNGPLSRLRPGGLWNEKGKHSSPTQKKTSKSARNSSSAFRDKPRQPRRSTSLTGHLRSVRSAGSSAAKSIDTTTSAGSAFLTSKNNISNTQQAAPPQAVPVCNATTPPNPEFLSRAGCRCLVIDLPGVLVENMTVTYRDGFVRAQGQRTIGNAKYFRKKIPINNKDQIVAEQLTAYLSNGVLLVVAPTKVAAAAVAAAVVVARIANKIIEKVIPPPPAVKLLTYVDWQSGTTSSVAEAAVVASTPTPIETPKSAFELYVSPQIKHRSIADFDCPDTCSINTMEESDELNETANGGISHTTMSSFETLWENKDIPKDDKRTIEEEPRSITETKDVGWTDDSLQDEPSAIPLAATPDIAFPRIRSPDMSRSYPTESVESPGIQASTYQAARPLTILQYRREEVWMGLEDKKETGIVVDDGYKKESKADDNDNGSAPVLPFQYELADLQKMENGLETELEPHPYWRSAPFLPSISSFETTSNSSSRWATNHHEPRLSRRNHPNPRKSPSPSSLLRRSGSYSPSASVLGSKDSFSPTPRKRVTWVDEI